MAVTLHQECRGRIEGVIADVLVEARVQNGSSITVESVAGLFSADDILPANERQRFQEYCGVTPIFTFVMDWIYRFTGETLTYDAEAQETGLAAVAGWADTRTVARNIVESLCTLPWPYTLTIEVPSAINSPMIETINGCGGSFFFGTDLDLVVPDEMFDEMYPLHNG